MNYGSVCSGIESAAVAWESLGWHCSFMSEIDPFACAVLKHRFPDVPLHGDFRTIMYGMYEPIFLLVGGTPCQDYSVAGLREGIQGERGRLSLDFISLAQRLKPRYIIWENVPGILSSGGGRDFGAFLGALVKCGYGIAYRILDAQFFGVPQRRRRMFVVGYFGDNGIRTGKILFDSDGVCRHSHQSRTKRKAVAALTANGVGACGADDNQAQAGHLIAGTLRASGSGVRRLMPVECERLQGFEDNWTLVPYRGKPAADGSRYKAIGNAMAVPCMKWIGKRIKMIEENLL